MNTAGRFEGGRAVADTLFRWMTLASASVVLAVLGLLTLMMVSRAWPVLGPAFVTSARWAPAESAWGAAAFVYGTVVSSLLALLLAVPVSLGIALFVTQVASKRVRALTVAVMDLLAVVPSVVFGLWGVLVLAPVVVTVYAAVHGVVAGVPLLGAVLGEPSPTGRSFFTAGVVLALMITPIITSLAREVIDTTPTPEKEAALALGATRWEMIRGAVLPHAVGGIVGAVMLGLGRAFGETIAVALVIGSSAQIVPNLFAAGDTMPAVIVNQWGEADDLHKSALVGLAVVLLAMTLAVNGAANTIVGRTLQRSRGAP